MECCGLHSVSTDTHKLNGIDFYMSDINFVPECKSRPCSLHRYKVRHILELGEYSTQKRQS